MSAWSPGRTDERGARLVELHACELAGDVEARHRLGVVGTLDEKRLQPFAGARGHEDPVGGETVGHHRLHAVELVASAAPVGAHVHPLDRDRRSRLRRARPFRAACRRRAPRAGRSRPRARAASVARIADEKNGPGNSAAPHLLLHHHRVDEAEPETARRLRHEHAGPAELDDLGATPRAVMPASSCSAIWRTYDVRGLGREERSHRVAQRQLLGREDEVHPRTLAAT